MRRLFILRPEPGASASLDRAKGLGLDAVAVPLFEVGPIPWDPPEAGSFDGLLLTSANAVVHAGEGLGALRGLPAYTVGEATAQAAREAGFDIAATGSAGIDRLLASIEPGRRLLHLAGEHRREPANTSHQVTTIAVYRSAALPRPSGLDSIGRQVAAAHSPRAAQRLAELVTAQVKASVRLACVSDAASEAAGEGWEAKAAAEEPTDEAVLALAARLCEKRTTE